MMDCLVLEVLPETKVQLDLPDHPVSTDMTEMTGLRVHLVCLETQEILVYLEREVRKVQEDLLATLAPQVQRAILDRLENEV